ncbi:MAG: Zn-dependent hydrolase [Actinobacteria bacterium]|nr:Zn-dependent hydrolase [Actinomycetota bacterium]
MITAADLERMLAEVEPIGLDPSGATTREAWTEEDRATREWFMDTASRIGLEPRRDPAGNLWATPREPGPWWACGSHLDSVRRGGRFDGALGVVAAFAAAERAEFPLAVVSFADEEGARFNTPTFGSRALVGALDLEDVPARVDDGGVTLAAALAEAGIDPAGLGSAPAWLEKLRGFVELHIDQTRTLAEAGFAAATVDGLAARMRLQATVRGQADHAGTTRASERHDALAAAARVIVAAEEEAGRYEEMVFTPARIEVQPNAATTVPARADLWLDARAIDPATVEAWRAAVLDRAREIARAAAVEFEARTASWSPGSEFDPAIRAALADALPPGSPSVTCFAGHDAGVVGTRLPTGMVFVRNEGGISHAPQESVTLADAAVAANGMLTALTALAEGGEG